MENANIARLDQLNRHTSVRMMRKMKMKSSLGAAMALSVMMAAAAAEAADPRAGAKLYNTHCAGCHGTRGVARMPGVPEFSRGERLLKADPVLLQSIENGSGVMPAFRGLMSTHEILDVIAYIRTLR